MKMEIAYLTFIDEKSYFLKKKYDTEYSPYNHLSQRFELIALRDKFKCHTYAITYCTFRILVEVSSSQMFIYSLNRFRIEWKK